MPNSNINRRFASSNSNFDGYFIIAAGQSNNTEIFTTSGNLPAANQGSLDNVFTYYKTADDFTDNGSWVNLISGTNGQTGAAQAGRFSITNPLAYKLFNTYGKPVYICPCGFASTYLADDVSPASWYPTHNGEYYKRALDLHIKPAYFKIRDTQRLKPILLWIQGESDADTVAHGTGYEAALTTFISVIRTDTGFTDMPVIITALRSDYGGANLGLTQLRTSQVNVAANVSRVYLFDTTAYPLSSDTQHYKPIVASDTGTLSAVELGKDIATFIDTNIKPLSVQGWSTTPSSGDAESQELYARFNTDPGTTRKTVINTFITGMKSTQYLFNMEDKLDFIHFYAAHDSQAASLNWVKNANTATTGGVAPTFTTDRGYKNTGNGWIDTNWNAITQGVNFSRNSGSCGVYVRDNAQSGGVMIGAINATAVTHIQPRDTLDRCNFTVNQAASTTIAGSTDSRGFWHIIRTASNAVSVYRNGVLFGTGANVSLTPVSGNLYVLAFNDTTGVPFNFAIGLEAAMVFSGSENIDPAPFYTSVQAYMTSVGANV